MKPDLWSLYRLMLLSRLLEEAVIGLWEEGLIFGEMHLGTGEEAVVAGVVSQMTDGDAMAMDHRGTPPMVMRGIDPVLLLKEFLGREDGLCSGMGGHMHLFSKEHLAASSGIVGSSGPAAVGFALAATLLRQGSLAIAFFGEGALNQGMLLEALNLAVVWNLPILFICKNNEWATSTHSPSVTGGNPIDRARSFGMHAIEVDGSDVEAVWEAARDAMDRARTDRGPTFLMAHCSHLEGHFLGDPLMRAARHPIREMAKYAGSMARALTAKGGTSLRERFESLGKIGTLGGRVADQITEVGDPLEKTRQKFESEMERLLGLEEGVKREVLLAVDVALGLDGNVETS
ncbi:MAG: thiamine pyrophosphate-dependent dehydrogenase E1 component subunit alpha [Anaerolineales bacterium]|nr:thiamine pyrophosphate-dependent dehydrogenase E1 component subunit alpha [Anaerolineales bacterium]